MNRLLYSLLFEHVDWPALPARDWALLGWMAAVPLGLAYMGWFGALQRLPATTASMGTLLVPVVGVLGGAVAARDVRTDRAHRRWPPSPDSPAPGRGQ